jgi:hypothetical protein
LRRCRGRFRQHFRGNQLNLVNQSGGRLRLGAARSGWWWLLCRRLFRCRRFQRRLFCRGLFSGLFGRRE